MVLHVQDHGQRKGALHVSSTRQVSEKMQTCLGFMLQWSGFMLQPRRVLPRRVFNPEVSCIFCKNVQEE
jgi:hypothetical protein